MWNYLASQDPLSLTPGPQISIPDPTGLASSHQDGIAGAETWGL